MKDILRGSQLQRIEKGIVLPWIYVINYRHILCSSFFLIWYIFQQQYDSCGCIPFYAYWKNKMMISHGMIINGRHPGSSRYTGGYSTFFTGWWFGCHFLNFPRNIGFLSSSQLTFIFFRGLQTTNQFNSRVFSRNHPHGGTGSCDTNGVSGSIPMLRLVFD